MIKLPRLRILRLEALHSQSSLKALAKVARGTISHIEDGGDCSMLTAHKLAQALDTTPEALQGIEQRVVD